MNIQQIEGELLQIAARKMVLESAQDRIDGEIEKLIARRHQLIKLVAFMCAAKGLRERGRL
jgi:hypothetical protein